MDFQRDKTGQRLDFGGVDLVHPVDLLPAGKYPFAQNVRRYIKGGIIGRNLLTATISGSSPASSSSTSGTVTQSGGGASWSDLSFIFATSHFSLAFTTIGGSASASSEVINVTNMGFAIPVGATVLGIAVRLLTSVTDSTGVTFTVQPTVAGSPVGTSQQITLTTDFSEQFNTFGGSATLWGFAWTPANVNGASGIGMQISAVVSPSTVSALISANNLKVTVYYSSVQPVNVTDPPHTIRRLNDSTPNGPVGGYVLVIGAAGKMYVNASQVASGMSGNPVSLIPFRPNTSVQPWMYVGDSSQAVTPNGYSFQTTGMLKIRSDGLIYKMGIEEPQVAPVIGTAPSSVNITGTLQATAIPWTNYSGQNSGYNYGQTHGVPDPTPDGTGPFLINCANASTVTITSLTGTATINGGSKTPTSAGPTPGATNPGGYVQVGGVVPVSVSVVVGAFTDGAGNVVPLGVAPLFVASVVDIGGNIGTAIPVPFGAKQFQVGINSTGNATGPGFSANSGTFALAATVTTNALPTVTAILGDLTAYYFDDSPTSGPVGSYIWKNPDDPGGSGPVRSISDAVGSTTGNSFIFDATFTAGLPGLPGIGSPTVPMLWTVLNPDSTAIATNPVFAAPLTKTYPTNTSFTNFNFCLVGSIFFPGPGNYTFVLTNHDDILWGIGGGVTFVSVTTSGSGEGSDAPISDYGQTITVVGGYPLLPRQRYTSGSGGNYAQSTVVVNVPAAGIYPIEVDFDYWFHSGRILLVDASATASGSATIIPPLPSSVRQQTQYRYVYRSTATGAVSNPSPESAAETIPVTANTITSTWSPDPQVDVVDYYRIDSVTSDFTYVNTGPNDNLGGGGTNTPVTDSLLDTDLGSQLLDFDNFEPFPSIDLPQKGICSVSGGVITWVSGGAIGGSQTGFNTRWLGGTEILIGSPTSLAYTFIARPTSNTSVTIPGVPDGNNLTYEIPEPILAAQPLAYMFGPTDNINFIFAVGDSLRPGTLYWCKGSNLDSAPDTNQLDVTDPGEPLVNGAMSNGRGVLFSIKRAWVIMPNFFNAEATATGTSGSTWTLQDTAITRGLYMPRCLAIDGGGNIFFRVNDGIHASGAGGESKSITDEDLYPLFPHETADGGTSIPQPITIAGNTIYPPNDSLPQAQRFSIQGAYLYYDYVGTDNNPHTLVFDIAAMGWVPDVYQWPATIHAANEDTSSTGTLAGCNDGSVRQFANGATAIEVATAVLLTKAEDFGDTRGIKKIGDLYIETVNP